MSTEFTVALFDEKIEDMLADEWGEVDAQNAVDLAEIVYAVNVARQAEGRPLLALPLGIQRQLLECSKRGMHKGKGRKHPPDRYVVKKFKEAILYWAKDRQQELYDLQGMKSLEAQLQAADEAEDLARKHGLKRFSAATIKRMMENNSDN